MFAGGTTLELACWGKTNKHRMVADKISDCCIFVPGKWFHGINTFHFGSRYCILRLFGFIIVNVHLVWDRIGADSFDVLVDTLSIVHSIQRDEPGLLVQLSIDANVPVNPLLVSNNENSEFIAF